MKNNFALDAQALLFQTFDEYEAYTSDPEYETESKPGICFAVEISDNLGNGSNWPSDPQVDIKFHADATPGISPSQNKKEATT